MKRRQFEAWFPKIISKGAILLLISLLVLPACGGGGGGGDGATGEEITHGEIAISLTDAPSDFAAYTVDVKSIKLKTALGAEVETLPLSQRVDFSQYADMTEFVTTYTIPIGVYTEATLTLDYTNADIRVEDNNKNIVKVTNIVDEDGNEIKTLTASVHLGVPALTILPGVAYFLTLDFNLKASNEVVLADNGTPTQIIVSPMLLANITPQLDKIIRARGMLADVHTDRDPAFFDMAVMPFIHQISGNQDHFGTLRVIPDDNTIL